MFVLAWWGGFWPTFYAAILVRWFSITPSSHQSARSASNVLKTGSGSAVFAAIAIATGWLGEKFHSAKRDGQHAIEQATKEGEQLRVTIAERRRAEEALNFLAAASTTLAALADRQSALQQAARLPVPFLADWCVVYVIDEHGAIDYHAHAHRELQKEALLGADAQQVPARLEFEHGDGSGAADGQTTTDGSIARAAAEQLHAKRRTSRDGPGAGTAGRDQRSA